MKIPWFLSKSLQALALIVCALAVSIVQADVPDDSEDPVLGGVTLGNPLTIPTQTGTLTYTAGSGAVGNFVVNATPLSTNFGDGGGYITFAASPTPTLTIQFGVDKLNCVPDPNTIGLTRSCPVAQGPGITNLFQMTGTYSNPAYSGYNGTQLTGVITQFGFSYTATGIDTFDMRITVTGGTMASLFQGKDIGVRIQAENSSFHGNFNENFGANPAKPTVGSVAPRLGDRVWEDKNGNGQQDCTYTPASFVPTNSTKIPGLNATCTEPGIPNVTVKLVDCSDSSIVKATTTTDANGFYAFTSPTILPAPGGTHYCVKFDPSSVPTYCADKYPNGPRGALKFTKRFVGDSLTDSNADQTNGESGPVNLLPGEINQSIDAGMYCPVALGDTVWNDTDNNGIQYKLNLDLLGGELGINELRVELYDCNGTLLNWTTTANVPDPPPFPGIPQPPQPGTNGGAGWYGFNDLAPGCYRVQFFKPDNSFFSPNVPVPPNDPALDSNPNPATGRTGDIILSSGDYNPTIDAGIYQPTVVNSSLGNFLWHDLNANGIQDANEPGIANVPVTLLDGTCANQLKTMNTGSGGSLGLYQFSNLQAGDYCVKFDRPANFCLYGGNGTPNFSPKDATVDWKDSDAITSGPSIGQTGKITLPANINDDTWDAGVYCPAQIGNFVWEDCNRNGIQDDADIPDCNKGDGYPGVTVNLLDCNGSPVTDSNGNPISTTTGAGGLYTFLVKPGSYIVEFVKPGGTEFTKQGPPGAANDSDANPSTGRTACLTVKSNQNDDTWDAGVYTPTQPRVTLVKFTNGYDGNSPNGDPTPTPPNGPFTPGDNKIAAVAVGGTVTWTYRVSNIGSEPLASIVVTDPRATAQSAVIVCPGTSLAVGASMDCTATLPSGAVNLTYGSSDVVAGCGDGNRIPLSPTYENLGTVTANGQFSQAPVSANDPSHYCNPKPGVKLVKFTNGWDANDRNGTPTPTPPPGQFNEGGNQVPQVAVGGEVKWTYRVINTGNEPLTSIQVTDSANVTVACPPITSLAVGKSVDCLATLIGGAKQLTQGGSNVVMGCSSGGHNDERPTYENIGYVFANGQLSQTWVNDDDPSHYCNPPALKLKLVKFTNGYDANFINGVPTPTPPNGVFTVGDTRVPEVAVGGTVTWTYRVSNEGGEALVNVTVTDSALAATNINCGSGTNTIALLPVGGTVDCTATLLNAPELVLGGNVSPGCLDNRPTYENMGYASGKGQNSNMTVNASPDSSHYCNSPGQAKPQLTVVKTPDGGTFMQGAQVIYTIVVSNPAATGAESATNVKLSDTLPNNGGLVWATATTSQGSCTLSGNSLNCLLGTIAPQASVTVTVKSTTSTPPAACQSQPNPAAIATADKGLTAQDAGSLSCTPPQLKVVKTPDGVTFMQGAQVSYTIVVSNPAALGAQSATSVNLTDALPGNGGLVWTTATTTQGSCTNPIVGNNLSCSLGTIPAQGSVTVTVTSAATTPPAACQSQPNPAAIATADGGLSAQDAGSLSCTPSNTAGLGDYVWKDINGNGIQDAGEPGINGVTVNLYSCNGTTPIQNTITATNNGPINPNPNKDGYYSFTGLAAGCYFVEFVKPDGYVFTIPYQPPPTDLNSPTDSNADQTTGRTGDVTLAAGVFNPTIDAGLVPGQDQCPPDGTTLPGDGKAGKLYVWQDSTYVYVRYDQSTNLNDNSYGTNAVGWPNGHTFGNLTGSDKAEFIFSDNTGATVLDFFSDYVTATTTAPSGYKSFGPFGGDGSCVTGNCMAWVKDYTTSMADNLNKYCSAGNCLVGTLDLKVNSPPTVLPGYTLPPGSPFTNWNFVNSYSVKIDKAAFTNGFGSVEIGLVHNSPAKVGSNAINPEPCVGGPTPSCKVSAGTPTVKDKNFKWPITNGGSSKVTLNQITVTWPASNGYLSKAKFDGDVIWDGTANCVSGTCSTTITAAQMTTDSKKKSIDPGKTRQFTLEFQNNAGTTLTNYTVGLDFGNDCGVTYGQPPVSCKGKIGDFVWKDVDGDGIQGGAYDVGISGVSVTLSQNGTVKATATTDGGGQYLFSGLCANTYEVKVATPFGYTPTITCNPSNPLCTTATDSNPNPSTVVLATDNSEDLTIDFGFKSTGGIAMCPTTPITGFGPGNPIGILKLSIVNGNIVVQYDQNPGLNDNSYGANAVGWPNGHTFGNLTGSDSGEFVFYRADGTTKVLDFELDYLTTKAGTPSGYASLGPDGGDGSWIFGTRANVLSWTTSLADNLNLGKRTDTLALFCSGGACTVNGTNLLVDTPPTVSKTSYVLPAGSVFGNWNFVNSYTVTVNGAAFGSFTAADLPKMVKLGLFHDSPPKAGSNAVYPIPCP